jgi:hypothetical protein
LFALPPFLYFKKLKGRSLIFKVGDFVKKKGSALLFAIPLVLIEVIFRAFRGWSFLQNPIFYFGFFFYGFFIFSDERFPQFLSRDRKMLLTLAILGTLILFFMINIGWGFNSSDGLSSPDNYLLKRIIFQVLRGFTIWVWVFAFLSLGIKYLNFNNRLLKYATEAALPFYILHQTVIVVIGFYVIQLSLGLLAKYFLITTGSLILTVAIYDLFVRRSNITRFLFGMRLLKK